MKSVVFAILLSLSVLNAQKSALPFPYELSLQRDLPIGTVVIGSRITSAVLKKRQPHPSEAYILGLDPTELPSFDESAIRRWSPGADDASDIFKNGSTLSPFLLTVPLLWRKQFRETLTLSVMYVEATLLCRSLTGMVKYTARRPRPYLYNDAVAMSVKLGEAKNATRSFFSGHTSTAFCGAIFTATLFQDMYPDSPARFWVWGGAVTLAGTTGILRYYAGNHYPSDILVGALVGSALGYFLPRFHRNRYKKVSLSLRGGAESELALRIRF